VTPFVILTAGLSYFLMALPLVLKLSLPSLAEANVRSLRLLCYEKEP
jgi:hypothetical protein